MHIAEKPRPHQPTGWRGIVVMLPGVGIALLPKYPACLPAYSAFLSSVGLGFMIDTVYLLPLTALLLMLAVKVLAFEARRSHSILMQSLCPSI
jgi:hypothetical protein